MPAIALDIKVVGDLDIEDDIAVLEERFANQIPIEARRIIDESTPRGRIYRRGAITGRRTAEGMRMGLKPRGKSRMITGSRFHRASAPGQPPAVDTGRLRRDITVVRTGRGRYRVRFGASYAGFLEFSLNRPFVLPAIEAAAREVFGT